MPRYIIEGSAAEIGVLVIDWDARTFTVHGAAGDEINSLTMSRAAELIAGTLDREATAHPFVLWPENADDFAQLEFRASLEDIDEASDGLAYPDA